MFLWDCPSRQLRQSLSTRSSQRFVLSGFRALSSLLLHPACSFCSHFPQLSDRCQLSHLAARPLAAHLLPPLLAPHPCCCRCSVVSSSSGQFSSQYSAQANTGLLKIRLLLSQTLVHQGGSLLTEGARGAAQANHCSPHIQNTCVFTNHSLASSLC